MRIVIALGGNALLRREQRPTLANQRENAATAAAALAPLLPEHEVVITHGNGPQVGLLALQAEADPEASPYPLDVLDAETEGMIGYLLEQEFRRCVVGREFATVLTQVLVDRDDPAFAAPSKPIGPTYSRDRAERLAMERGWTFTADGDGFRRTVPSPEPHSILELSAIQTLLDAGFVVICGGGGGIPVARSGGEAVRGVEAVVDKDLTSSLLACQLHADVLLLLTDVPAVMRGWKTSSEQPVRSATPGELRALGLAAGSMGPKAEAAARFAESGGRFAAIGGIDRANAVFRQQAGTVVRARR